MRSDSQSGFPASVTQEDFWAILDCLAEGAVVLDDAGAILGVNRAACEILEVKKNVALGADFGELIEERACNLPAHVRDAIRDGQPLADVAVELSALSGPSGRKRAVILRADLLGGEQGRGRRTVVVLRDVTEPAGLKQNLEAGSPPGPVDRAEASSGATEPSDPAGPGRRVDQPVVSPEAAREALAATGWNVAEASRLLGVSRTTLYKRMTRLGLRRQKG